MDRQPLNEDTVIKQAFSWWKIWLAIFFGLSIASWMMYRSLTQQQFIKVEQGKGDYIWKDYNHDHLPNLLEAKEFVKQDFGNYKIETISETLASIDWSVHSVYWFLAAILCMIGRDFFYMIRIRILTKNLLTWKKSFNVIMIWEFASALSPGVMSGAAVAMFILHREKVPLGRSTAIVIITAFMDNLFYVIMVPLVLLFINQEYLFSIHTQSSLGVKWVFWTGFIVIVSICLFLFSSIFIFPKLASKLFDTIFRISFLKKWHPRAMKTSHEMEIASKELKKEKPVFWLKAFAATLASWTSRYLVINCILNAFLALDLFNNIQVFGKQFVLWLFMRMSPTPGGSGVAEYAFGELLGTFTTSGILIAGLAILWRLISYFPYLFIGAIILPKWMKRG